MVHNLIDNFEAFNITSAPKEKNTLVDSLANAASILSPLEYYESSRFLWNYYTNHQYPTIFLIGRFLKEIYRLYIF
jgi:abortive infection bacteriophage resistance protein